MFFRQALGGDYSGLESAMNISRETLQRLQWGCEIRLLLKVSSHVQESLSLRAVRAWRERNPQYNSGVAKSYYATSVSVPVHTEWPYSVSSVFLQHIVKCP